jgi:NAD(P)H-hydrate epimerase
LTPHPGEFKRLAGKWANDFQRLKMQIDFSIKNKVILILKNAHTSISLPNGEVFFNSTGNPGMATVGIGDFVTGILTSLLSQGYSPQESSLIGVFIHGFAGDIACRCLSEEGLIASDIIDYLPNAFKKIQENS